MLDVDSPNITAKIRRIVVCLDTTPHLFRSQRVPFIHERQECIAAEFKPNPSELEDMCMLVLRTKAGKPMQCWLIAKWLDEQLIDEDQVRVMCGLCGIDPKDIRA